VTAVIDRRTLERSDDGVLRRLIGVSHSNARRTLVATKACARNGAVARVRGLCFTPGREQPQTVLAVSVRSRENVLRA
jgi:hypothetical protein